MALNVLRSCVNFGNLLIKYYGLMPSAKVHSAFWGVGHWLIHSVYSGVLLNRDIYGMSTTYHWLMLNKLA
jgi:hypothetical protein